jgi:hypothetical protein
LDEGRDARDRRIEETAAEVFVLLEERAAAEAKASEKSVAIGERLRRLLAEDVGVVGVARLVELDVAEVRRLTKPPVADNTESLIASTTPRKGAGASASLRNAGAAAPGEPVTHNAGRGLG